MTNDWQDRCTLIHGPYEQTLEAVEAMGGADLVAFSPPYCDARTYGMDVSWDDADYARLGDFVFRALKPGGHALVNVDAPVREWRPGFGTERGFHPWRMMLDWAERVGFRVPDRLAFGRDGAPGAYAGRFRNDWEPLLWFQRPGGDGWFEKRSIARKSKGQRSGQSRRSDGQAGTGSVTTPDIALPTTCWAYGTTTCGGAPDIEAQGHPARWPYKLASDIVRCFCSPGGLVVDPFVGAGTTAAAALDHGRRFVGGDLGSRQDHEQNRARGLDPVPWVEVTRRVLTERYRQQSLFGGAR